MCRTAGPVSGLVRLAWPMGVGVPVVGRTEPGRGAWVHLSGSCVAGLRSTDLARAFRRTVSADQLDAAVAACRAAAVRAGFDG